MMMNRNSTNQTISTSKQIIAAILAFILMSVFLPVLSAHAEATESEVDFASTFDMDGWNGEDVILEDPQYFLDIEDEPDEAIPVITSAGKSNVKIGGVKSKHQLVSYTIPEQLLEAILTSLR